jgi:hypothetical protein
MVAVWLVVLRVIVSPREAWLAQVEGPEPPSSKSVTTFASGWRAWCW